ncbi:MAG: FUSC family protein, partial [Actinomycetes bacterium]
MQVPGFLIARRGRVRLRGVRTLKSTFAAVAAYLVALPVSDNPQPVLAPLTALLVVQLTLYDTFRTGLRRVVSVVAGVLVAVLFAEVVGELTWWSLGIMIGLSLVVARLLRLGAEMLEVPISAMLVLAVGGSDAVASGRVLESIVGAVVGVVVSVVAAPPLYVRPASDAVQSLAGVAADVMRRVAHEVQGEYTADQARAWLEAARGLGRDVLRADQALARAEESLRYNPRAVRRRHTGPSLRSAIDSLERTSVALRSVCRSLADRAAAPDDVVPEQVYAEDVRRALSELLADLADATEAYGVLVGSEVAGPGPEDAALRDALARAWRHRDELVGLLRSGDRLTGVAWELHGDLAANIDRLLREIDSDARAELRQTWPTRPPAAAHAEAARAGRAA